ncbi:MAG: DUF4954 family protein [Candidatus Omnitrophica bacterium]|nr:DUF4954 family protein [Candidatus Omnitrophota bacterium]
MLACAVQFVLPTNVIFCSGQYSQIDSPSSSHLAIRQMYSQGEQAEEYADQLAVTSAALDEFFSRSDAPVTGDRNPALASFLAKSLLTTGSFVQVAGPDPAVTALNTRIINFADSLLYPNTAPHLLLPAPAVQGDGLTYHSKLKELIELMQRAGLPVHGDAEELLLLPWTRNVVEGRVAWHWERSPDQKVRAKNALLTLITYYERKSAPGKSSTYDYNHLNTSGWLDLLLAGLDEALDMSTLSYHVMNGVTVLGAESVHVNPRIKVGEIGEGAVLGPNAVLIGDVRIGEGSRVQNSTLENVHVGQYARIEHSNLRWTHKDRLPVGKKIGVVPEADDEGKLEIAMRPGLKYLEAVRIMEIQRAARGRDGQVYQESQEELEAHRAAARKAAEQLPSHGWVGDETVIIYSADIRDAWIGARNKIEGVQSIKGLYLANQHADDAEFMEKEHVGIYGALELEDVMIHPRVVVGAGVIARSSYLMEGSIAGTGAKLENVVLGPSAWVEKSEIASSFLGPFFVSHHQNSLVIGIYAPEGRVNIASGFKHSNHPGTSPLHMVIFKAGGFPGLDVNVGGPAYFERGTFIARGVTTLPGRVEVPFSTIELSRYPQSVTPVSVGINQIHPGAVLNMRYSLLRNFGGPGVEGKYKKRERARNEENRLQEYDVFNLETYLLMTKAQRFLEALKPDTVQMGADFVTDEGKKSTLLYWTRDRIKTLVKDGWLPQDVYMDIGKNFFTLNDRDEGIENFRFERHLYALRRLAHHLDEFKTSRGENPETISLQSLRDSLRKEGDDAEPIRDVVKEFLRVELAKLNMEQLVSLPKILLVREQIAFERILKDQGGELGKRLTVVGMGGDVERDRFVIDARSALEQQKEKLTNLFDWLMRNMVGDGVTGGSVDGDGVIQEIQALVDTPGVTEAKPSLTLPGAHVLSEIPSFSFLGLARQMNGGVPIGLLVDGAGLKYLEKSGGLARLEKILDRYRLKRDEAPFQARVRIVGLAASDEELDAMRDNPHLLGAVDVRSAQGLVQEDGSLSLDVLERTLKIRFELDLSRFQEAVFSREHSDWIPGLFDQLPAYTLINPQGLPGSSQMESIAQRIANLSELGDDV